MRKIEKEMIEAIRRRKGFRKANTEVVMIATPKGKAAEVFLHGNHIATHYYDEGMTYPNVGTLSQWPTVTTKSRLRALGFDVTTRKGQTFIEGGIVR